MANIFQLSDQFKQLVEMADQIDDQTLEDTLEALGEMTADKVANTIAVIKSVDGELEVAKQFKKDLDARIKTMENTKARLNEYIMLGVDTVGTPKKDAPDFKKLEIKNAPWVKSVWTQLNPPKVNIVDNNQLSEEYLVPQPPKPDSKKIAADWKKKSAEYAEQKEIIVNVLRNKIESGEMTEAEAEDELFIWERENKHNYEIAGVEVQQTVGIRYR